MRVYGWSIDNWWTTNRSGTSLENELDDVKVLKSVRKCSNARKKRQKLFLRVRRLHVPQAERLLRLTALAVVPTLQRSHDVGERRLYTSSVSNGYALREIDVTMTLCALLHASSASTVVQLAESSRLGTRCSSRPASAAPTTRPLAHDQH